MHPSIHPSVSACLSSADICVHIYTETDSWYLDEVLRTGRTQHLRQNTKWGQQARRAALLLQMKGAHCISCCFHLMINGGLYISIRSIYLSIYLSISLYIYIYINLSKILRCGGSNRQILITALLPNFSVTLSAATVCECDACKRPCHGAACKRQRELRWGPKTFQWEEIEVLRLQSRPQIPGVVECNMWGNT